MVNKIKFILNAVAYGLAAALVIIILSPELRTNLGLTQLTNNVIRPNAISFAEAVKQAAPAVVNIYSTSQVRPGYDQLDDLGSGVIMTSNGHILTNYHVVDRAEAIIVDLQDGRQFNAEVIGVDKATDLALLKIDANNLPTIPQEPDIEPQVGDIVLAIGNPLNWGQTITQGIISATSKKKPGSAYVDYIQMDAAINIGNSGGALVNSQGTLVGINTAAQGTVGVQGIFFAIPYKLAKSVMDKLLIYGEVTRGYIGISGEQINQYGQPVRAQIEPVAGVLITEVDPFGPAWAAGLRRGDIVFALNGKQVVSILHMSSLVENMTPGNEVILDVSREKKIIKLPVTIGKLGDQ